MKNKLAKHRIKIFFKKILKDLLFDQNTISSTIVGSFSETFNFKNVGDIDVVLICKKITRKYYKDYIKIIKMQKNKLLQLSDKKNLKINTTFGPIKFDNSKTLIIHLMIYDYNSHVKHALASPFTCYDWQRSNFYCGNKLEKIFSIKKLQINDFMNSRRGIKSYINDLTNKNISYSKYFFNKNNVTLQKKKLKINLENQNKFIYHILKNIINNFVKFEKNKNNNFSNNIINFYFKKIINNNKSFIKFKLLSKEIFLKEISKEKDKLNLTKKFLKIFSTYLKNKYLNNNEIHFIRHQKTKINKEEFLGQSRNVSIVNKKIPIYLKKINYDVCYASPLKRSLQTSKLLVNAKKIKLSKNLIEMNYGNCEGLTYKDLNYLYPKFAKNLSSLKDPRFPNGENTEDVLKRLNKFIKKELINTKQSEKKILVVTHNVILRCLLGHYFNINKKYWYMINIKNLEFFEFILKHKKLIPNISRTKLKTAFNNLHNFY